MLRFHKFTFGSAWVPEYGDPQNATDFEYIIKYSPLHNIPVLSSPHQLPAVSIIVVPLFSSLHTAARAHCRPRRPCCSVALAQVHCHRVLYGCHTHAGMSVPHATAHTVRIQQQTNPLLARVDVRAGHGGGKPTKKSVSATLKLFVIA